MNASSFANALRVARGLSRSELIGAGIVAPDSLASWKRFEDDPLRFFLTANETQQAEIWALVYAKLAPLEMKHLPQQALVFVDGIERLRAEAMAAYARTGNTRWFDRGEYLKQLAGFVLGAFIDHDAQIAALRRLNAQLELRARNAEATLHAVSAGLGPTTNTVETAA